MLGLYAGGVGRWKWEGKAASRDRKWALSRARRVRPALLPLLRSAANRSVRSRPLYPLQIWVTTIVLGHLLGIAFLLYSVERVTGVFSRLARKAGLTKAGEADAVDGGLFSVAGAKAIDGAFVEADEDAAAVRAPRWVRGCACKV
jgi:hypothetical protein